MSASYTATFQPQTGTVWTSNDLQFTAPVVTETDVGAVSPFLNPASLPNFSLTYVSRAHEVLAEFGGGNAAVTAPGQSISVNISYNVSVVGGAHTITGLGELVVQDSVPTSGAYTLPATETVTDPTSGLVVASMTWTPAASNPSVTFASGYQSLNISISLQASEASNAVGSVGFSSVQQSYFETAVTATPAITVDKQISIDGVHWYDVGQNNLAGPTVLAGDKVYERAIVVDSGNTALSGVTVADLNGLASGDFTFGGAASISMTAGQTITSDIGTIAAASVGTNYDTAIATGTVSSGGTVTNTDTADYTGVKPAITIDKQISVNGGQTWQDVGNGNLTQDPTVLANATVDERVIVVNTGGIVLDNATVTDLSNTGGAFPPDFTFGGLASVATLGVGQTITSDVASFTASAGYQLDTATVTATATDSVNTATVTASDQANYTGVVITGAGTPIVVDKQISVNGGATWQDVGVGNLAQDPTVFVGSTVEERVIVSDVGSLALTNVSVSDAIGSLAAGGFSFGGAATTSIAAGGSVISDVMTITAASGYQLDTATGTGIVTDNAGNTGTVTASDQANYTGVTPGIGIDKQISVNGGATWLDVGNGNLAQDPVVLTGATVEERVIVTNTGAVALNSLSVADSSATGTFPADFTFNAGTAVVGTLGVGQSIVSDVATFAASSGQQLDTATASATATDSAGNTKSLSASDQANYIGVTPSIGIDKQVSVNGGATWVDVGTALNDPTVLAGGMVEERVIVTDTGSIALTGLAVTDTVVAGSGTAQNFVLTSTSLAAGASEISNVVSFAALVGHQVDQAGVTGTATDSAGNTQSVSASDQADYTGVTPSISIDKQVSVNGGATWVDVGQNVLNDPSILAGFNVEERVIVTDTGSIALSNIAVTDTVIAGTGAAQNFTLSSSTLAAGASEVSNVVTFAALAGHQVDQAGVTGTATDSAGNQTSVSASDQADYTGIAGAITVDKQVSVNGGATWQDVGQGVLNDPVVAAGGTVLERVIVVNTGTVALNNISVSDVEAMGTGTPASFTFAAGAAATLAAGATIVSNVATLTAASGHNIDTATASGTYTDTINTGTVSASDQADYTGTVVSTGTPGISVLKVPCSVVVCSGQSETYTFYVTNTGSVALTNVQIKDNIGTAANPDYVTPTAVTSGGYNVGDTNHDGILSVGETWQYTETVTLTGTAAAGGTGTGGSGDQSGSGGACNTGSSGSGDNQQSGSGSSCGTGGSGSGDNQQSGSGWGQSGSGSSSWGSSGPGWGNSGLGDNQQSGSGWGQSGSGGSSWGTSGSGWGNSGSGDNQQSGSGWGQSGSGGSSWGGSGSGWGNSGSGDNQQSGSSWGQSGSGGSSWGTSGSGWGNSGSGDNQQSGSGSTCDTGSSGSGSNQGSGSGSGGTSLTALTTSQIDSLTSGAKFGPAAAATFTDGPVTVASGATSDLLTGPKASCADSVMLVVSASASDVASLGNQTITMKIGSETVSFTGADFATSAADGFPSSIGGIANGQVNGISFSNSEHAAVDLTYNSSLASLFGATGSNIAAVTITSPVNLRVDVFGDQNGKIIDNAANSGAEGVTGGGSSGGGSGGGSGGSGPTYTGVADTVTVSATTSGGTSVSASDTKEVLVLGSSSASCGSGGEQSGSGTGSGGNSGGGSCGSGSGDQSGSGSGCTTGSSGSGDNNSGSGDNSGSGACGSSGSGDNQQSGSGWGNSGSGDNQQSGSGWGQSGSGGSSWGASGSGWGSSGSGDNQQSGSGDNQQSGSGSTCNTGSSGSGDNQQSGSGWGQSGSGGSSWGGSGSGWGNSGSGDNQQSGSGSSCNTGSSGSGDNQQSGSGWGQSGSGGSSWGASGSGWGNSGSGDNQQSGSGSGCTTGSSGSGDNNSGSGNNSGSNSGWGSSGSGDQSGSGSVCNTGSSGSGDNNSGSGDNSGSSCGSSGSGDQSGSGSVCNTGSSGSGDNNSGSGCGTTITSSNACNSGISLNGTAPTGNLPTLYGSPDTLEFTYNPGNTVSLAQGSTALATVTGGNANSLAFMEFSNNSNPFATNSQIYFEGSVKAGENIFADATINPLTNTANSSATNHFSTAAGAELYGFVFTSQAAFLAGQQPIETMTLSTASGHGMSLGDTIGSVKLVGYVGNTGGHLIT